MSNSGQIGTVAFPKPLKHAGCQRRPYPNKVLLDTARTPSRTGSSRGCYVRTAEASARCCRMKAGGVTRSSGLAGTLARRLSTEGLTFTGVLDELKQPRQQLFEGTGRQFHRWRGFSVIRRSAHSRMPTNVGPGRRQGRCVRADSHATRHARRGHRKYRTPTLARVLRRASEALLALAETWTTSGKSLQRLWVALREVTHRAAGRTRGDPRKTTNCEAAHIRSNGSRLWSAVHTATV